MVVYYSPWIGDGGWGMVGGWGGLGDEEDEEEMTREEYNGGEAWCLPITPSDESEGWAAVGRARQNVYMMYVLYGY